MLTLSWVRWHFQRSTQWNVRTKDKKFWLICINWDWLITLSSRIQLVWFIWQSSCLSSLSLFVWTKQRYNMHLVFFVCMRSLIFHRFVYNYVNCLTQMIDKMRYNRFQLWSLDEIMVQDFYEVTGFMIEFGGKISLIFVMLHYINCNSNIIKSWDFWCSIYFYRYNHIMWYDQG